MRSLALQVLIGGVSYMVLDGIWLGLLMNGFYRQQLAPIARITNGGIAPNWSAALVVYVLLGLGIALLASPRASGLASAVAHGALFGLVVYGVYDFTNLATLRQWPLAITLVDLAWGVAASALAAGAVWALAR